MSGNADSDQNDGARLPKRARGDFRVQSNPVRHVGCLHTYTLYLWGMKCIFHAQVGCLKANSYRACRRSEADCTGFRSRALGVLSRVSMHLQATVSLCPTVRRMQLRCV